MSITCYVWSLVAIFISSLAHLSEELRKLAVARWGALRRQQQRCRFYVSHFTLSSLVCHCHHQSGISETWQPISFCSKCPLPKTLSVKGFSLTDYTKWMYFTHFRLEYTRSMLTFNLKKTTTYLDWLPFKCFFIETLKSPSLMKRMLPFSRKLTKVKYKGVFIRCAHHLWSN